ncbi:class I SAM-dependent methyltransferase [Marinobacter metalliresistant]|uniref:Class I SAM-dependent methyltransferase n=1 Tax=Marinobacter metalliresistant TaxID=2961995 RepID=A0ABZ2W4Q2_9GAMM
MIRQCFLCTSDVEPVFAVTWALPGLDAAEIGFSVCPNCGSVCQSPSIPPEDMMKYYSSQAVYTNPGRKGGPSATKVLDVNEQVRFVVRGIGKLPDSVLQIGSSDGYTLSRFREAGVKKVHGVEPGNASIEMAQNLYGIECTHCSAEEFETDDRFELILMTHVLEHLYDPQRVLEKCRRIQETWAEGFIYVEVPLLAPNSQLCPGFFSFEHINYYTRENLLESLIESGYSPVSVVEHYNSNIAPLIGVLASTQEQNHLQISRTSPAWSRNRLEEYRKRELGYWQGCLNELASTLDGAKRIFLWGAGIHTSQLIANTNLLDRYDISGLVDSSPLKWGGQQGQWLCRNPAHIEWKSGDAIVISSYASEDEIYRSLSDLRDVGCKTLRFHSRP